MKIVVICQHDKLLAQLTGMLAASIPALSIERDVVREPSLSHWFARMEAAPRTRLRAVRPDELIEHNDTPPGVPDFLILDEPEPREGAFETLERITRCLPQLTVILLTPERTPHLLMAAMQAGIREVLPLPPPMDDLTAAIDRAGQRNARGTPGTSTGKVLGFMACKGGSGATFIAANLGYALAVEHQKRVLLIDLDLQYGDASFFFFSDQKFPGSVAGVTRRPERMDAMLLNASCLKILPSFSILPAPDDPAEAATVTPEGVKQLIELAASCYDYVLIDMDRSIDAVSLQALDQADAIFAIMQSMVPDMRDARTLLRAFKQLGYADSKLQFIINRSDKKEDAPVRPIEKGLGIDFYRMIPNDYLNASASVNQGASILELAPASPVSKALREIADEFAGVASGRENWFRRLLRRA